MTPTEKALELLDTCEANMLAKKPGWMAWSNVKDAALEICDIAISAYSKSASKTIQFSNKYRIAYWKDVKQEIGKLW
jgi:hypothetical protein